MTFNAAHRQRMNQNREPIDRLHLVQQTANEIAVLSDYDVFELASNAITRLRLPKMALASREPLSVAEFIATCISGDLVWQCCDETAHVTEMIELWIGELTNSAPHLLTDINLLVGLAVEIGAVREAFYWEDINEWLSEMPLVDLTTGNAELNAWFGAYGTAMTS